MMRIEDHKESIKNNKLILRTLQRFRSEKLNVFTTETNKTVLRSNDDKRIQSIDSVETYAFGTSKDIVCQKEELKCNIIIRKYRK